MVTIYNKDIDIIIYKDKTFYLLNYFKKQTFHNEFIYGRYFRNIQNQVLV